MTSSETKKFSDQYQNLRNIAEELKNSNEIDVDTLLEKVKSATDSYKICKARLDNATKDLENIFKGVDVECVANGKDSQKAIANDGKEDGSVPPESDIPF